MLIIDFERFVMIPTLLESLGSVGKYQIKDNKKEHHIVDNNRKTGMRIVLISLKTGMSYLIVYFYRT